LGLQSASDETALRINRGYRTEKFTEAVRLLKDFGIPVVAHMIIGLPGESREQIDCTVDLLNSLDIWGVKIHSLYVCRGTALAKLYENGEYTPPTREEYESLAARTIARLKPEIVIHRITGDCPRELLVAPEWNLDKNGVINDIRRTLEEGGLYQGALYKK
ncbi:MAG: radical SAM protein, partial [Clostridia bacterium]|nr:radical SAM protein [Clostridia bacterium]